MLALADIAGGGYNPPSWESYDVVHAVTKTGKCNHDCLCHSPSHTCTHCMSAVIHELS